MASRGQIIPHLLRPLDRVRGLIAALGLNQIPVTLKSWVWSSGRIQTGVAVPRADLVIGSVPPGSLTPQPPVVRGTSGDLSVLVEYLTPAFYDVDGVTQIGGYTPAQLIPDDAPGLEWLYELTWPIGPRRYIVEPRGIDTSKPLHYSLRLVSIDRKVPF
jgi:hypothetical protein